MQPSPTSRDTTGGQVGEQRRGAAAEGSTATGSDLTDGRYQHEVLAVVLQVRPAPLDSPGPPNGAEPANTLHVLLWQRAQPPQAGHWALPGGRLGAQESLRESIQRQLAEKVDVRDLSHLEQLESLGDPQRVPPHRTIATTYLGLVPAGVEPAVPPDTRWHPVDALPPLAFDHDRIITAGRNRLRSKLSYTNLGFALAPARFTLSELTGYYRAALGHDVDATNLHRILVRREQIEPTGDRAPSGPSGGRPAAVFRFRTATLQVTDAFAVLHPPGG